MACRNIVLTCITGATLFWGLASAQSPALPALSSAATAGQRAALTQPRWSELSAAEQLALKPLAASWDSMSSAQKRKWQTVALDFQKLPAPQQAIMHARMAEWIKLTPQQRTLARHNFAQNRETTDGLTAEQRSVQWQAYQQLAPEEKRKLAESAAKPPVVGAAPAAKPQPVLRKEPQQEFGSAKALSKAQAASNAPNGNKKITVAPHLTKDGSVLPAQPQAIANKP